MLYSDKLISWLKEKKIYLKYSTYTNYCNVIHNHIMPDLGTYHIEELNNDILQELILQKLECGRKDRKGGISFKYAKDIIQILKFTLPFKVDIQLPYHPPKAVEIFEKEHQITLINHLQSEINHKNFGILLCIHTGIRIGELCALKWSDINTQTKLLKIDKTMIRTYTKEDGSHLHITPPKSRSSTRMIPLNTWIMHYAVLLQGDADNYVLTNRDKPIEPNKYRLYYNHLLKELELPHRKFHALRHTFATRAVEVGFEIKSLSEILGHSNTTITLERYVHSSMELKRSNMDKLTAVGL